VPESIQRPIAATTRYCAVYGHPIKHSASPAMQNAGIAELGLDWRYLAFEVHPDDLRQAIAGAKAMKYVGLNLTVPHKLLALDMVDLLDESARIWGAVNTIRFETQDHEGNWIPVGQFPGEVGAVRAHGFNTDSDAIVRALEEDLSLKLRGITVLLLGAGGAGRVAALRLASAGVAGLFLVNRTASKAGEIAAEIRDRFPTVKVETGYPSGPVELVLNATSLGLKSGDGSPLDEARFSIRRAQAVYDMI
jgi:shikimate dehydrogenase